MKQELSRSRCLTDFLYFHWICEMWMLFRVLFEIVFCWLAKPQTICVLQLKNLFIFFCRTSKTYWIIPIAVVLEGLFWKLRFQVGVMRNRKLFIAQENEMKKKMIQWHLHCSSLNGKWGIIIFIIFHFNDRKLKIKGWTHNQFTIATATQN